MGINKRYSCLSFMLISKLRVITKSFPREPYILFSLGRYYNMHFSARNSTIDVLISFDKIFYFDRKILLIHLLVIYFSLTRNICQ